MSIEIEVQRHTAGPWRWELNEKAHRVQLVGGVPRFDLTVVDFVRYGMGNAQPRFREDRDGLNLMHKATEHAAEVPGREHHADWFKTIDHPDARLIASAPNHALIARLICNGDLRWEPFGDGRYGELVLYGAPPTGPGGAGRNARTRHSTCLDEFGVPILTDHLRAEIARAGL